jgi:hypothetical protein
MKKQPQINGTASAGTPTIPATTTRLERIAMNIDTISAKLSDNQKKQLAEANELAGHIYSGGHLDECLTFIAPLSLLRHETMTFLHINQPKGAAYNEYFSSLVRRFMPNFMDGSKVHPWASALLWLAEGNRLAVLAEYREGLTKTQMAHLNTPKAAQNAVLRIEAQTRAKQQQAEREAGMTDLERDMAEQMRRDNVKPTVSDQQIVDGFLNRPIGTLVALMMGADELKMLELAQKILQDNDLNMTSAEAKIRRMRKAKRDALKQPANEEADDRA